MSLCLEEELWKDSCQWFKVLHYHLDCIHGITNILVTKQFDDTNWHLYNIINMFFLKGNPSLKLDNCQVDRQIMMPLDS